MYRLHINDQLLIDLLYMKDKRAFSFLYDTYSPALHGCILDILTEDKELAAQVLEQVFVTAWHSIGSYDRRKQRLFVWMLHIARRLTLAAVQQLNNCPCAAKLEEVSGGLRRVLKRMDKGPRQVIELVYYQGYTKAQVAETLHVSIDVVDKLLYAGLRCLQAYMKTCF